MGSGYHHLFQIPEVVIHVHQLPVPGVVTHVNLPPVPRFGVEVLDLVIELWDKNKFSEKEKFNFQHYILPEVIEKYDFNRHNEYLAILLKAIVKFRQV